MDLSLLILEANVSFVKKNETDANRTIELPGNLRIGGSFDIPRLPSFSVLVSCVGFFVGVRSPSADSILPLCNAWRGMLFIMFDCMLILLKDNLINQWIPPYFND